jgi:rubrerythrin
MAKENSKRVEKWMCAICGYVFENKTIPIKCPVCGAGKENFVKIK